MQPALARRLMRLIAIHSVSMLALGFIAGAMIGAR